MIGVVNLMQIGRMGSLYGEIIIHLNIAPAAIANILNKVKG